MPIVVGYLREICLFGRSVGIGPGGLVDLPQAPRLLTNLIMTIGDQAEPVLTVSWPVTENVDGRLRIELVEIVAITGQEVGVVRQVGLMGRIRGPSGSARGSDLLR